jgi:hypothetical protein
LKSDVNFEQKAMQKAMTRCGILTAISVGLWLLMLVPALLLSGARGLEGLSYAVLLCLAPGWLVFLLEGRYGVANANAAPVVLGMGLRMGSILLGALLIQSNRPALRFQDFLLWLLVIYMAALAIETQMLIKRPSA